jgi:peptide/nickel transport system ATP-binding protein
MSDLLLNIRGFEKQFKTRGGIVHAVNCVSLDMKDGETLDVIGESGCGRSAAMFSVFGLIQNHPGKVAVGEV